MAYKVPSSASSFRSSRLVFTPQRVKKVYTWQSYLICVIFFFMGGIPLLAALKENVSQRYVLFFISFIFAAAGIISFLYMKLRKKPEIDLEEKAFYPSGKGKDLLKAERISLSELEKLHIQSRTVRGKNSSYECYTLYLVFRRKGEYILLDHGNLNAFLADAEKLSELLNMPLPENSFLEEKKKCQAQGAGIMIVFGIIWSSMASLMLFITAKDVAGKNDFIPVFFLLPFELVGIFCIGYGIKLLRDKKNNNKEIK